MARGAYPTGRRLCVARCPNHPPLTPSSLYYRASSLSSSPYARDDCFYLDGLFAAAVLAGREVGGGFTQEAERGVYRDLATLDLTQAYLCSLLIRLPVLILSLCSFPIRKPVVLTSLWPSAPYGALQRARDCQPPPKWRDPEMALAWFATGQLTHLRGSPPLAPRFPERHPRSHHLSSLHI